MGRFSSEQLAHDVEDLATAFVRLEGGAMLVLETSWATHCSAADDSSVTLYGTEGGIELVARNYAREHTVRVFHDVAGAAVDMSPNIPKSDGHLAVIKRFISAICDSGPICPGSMEGLRRTAVIETCYRSAAEGKEVPCSPITHLECPEVNSQPSGALT